jgi:hypothetical protein
MKTLFFVSVSIVSFFFSLSAQDMDAEAIKQVIQEAYVDGLQNRGEIAPIRRGFDPGFELLGIRENQLTKLSIGDWIANLERSKEANPNPPQVLTTVNFVDIDITGIAAIAKIELYRAERKIFTDYLSLYRFEEGWKIVGKIYHRH